MEIAFLIIPAVFIVAGLTGWLIARHDIDGGWHRRFRHKHCGFHSRYNHKMHPCARCGDEPQPSEIETITARAVPLFGWEIKGEEAQ